MHQDYAVDVAQLSGPALAAGRFSAESTAHLPEPARRWLAHSIAPGTPLYSSVTVEMEGEIKLGHWHRFTAHQIIQPGAGYVWSAVTHVAGVRISGSDRMIPDAARMHWQAMGLLPVIRSSGPDVLNSAAGRLAGESVFVPTTFAKAQWEPMVDPDIAVASWRVGSRVDRVRLQVASNGALMSVALRRWGRPPGTPYGRYPFGVRFDDEQTFGPITIPSTMHAHWWWGTEMVDAGEFYRARILSATFA